MCTRTCLLTIRMEWSQATPGSFLTQPVTRNIFLRRQFFVGWEAGHRLESSLREKLESAQKMLGAQHACSEFDKPTFFGIHPIDMPSQGQQSLWHWNPGPGLGAFFCKRKTCTRKSFGVDSSLTTPCQAICAEACERSGRKAESHC